MEVIFEQFVPVRCTENSPVTLSEAQREELRKLAESSSLRAQKRALVVLDLADGLSIEEVMKKRSTDEKHVRKWKWRYIWHGVEGLTTRPKRFQWQEIPGDTLDRMRECRKLPAPDGARGWTAAMIGDYANVTAKLVLECILHRVL